LLQDSTYPSTDPSHGGPYYTFQQLLGLVQASRAEIAQALNAAGAVQAEGCIRQVSQEAKSSALQMLLQTAVAQSWDLAAVEENKCLDTMQEAGLAADVVVCRAVLRTLRASVAVKAWSAEGYNAAADQAPNGVWSLDNSKVRAAAAHLLFHQRRSATGSSAPSSSAASVPASMELEDFLQEWALVCPGLLAAGLSDLAALKGVVVLAPSTAAASGAAQVVVYCPAEELVSLEPKVSLLCLPVPLLLLLTCPCPCPVLGPLRGSVQDQAGVHRRGAAALLPRPDRRRTQGAAARAAGRGLHRGERGGPAGGRGGGCVSYCLKLTGVGNDHAIALINLSPAHASTAYPANSDR
jgi:hypothetical protein